MVGIGRLVTGVVFVVLMGQLAWGDMLFYVSYDTKEDRDTIDEREKQRLARIDPDKPPIVWQPSDAAQTQGEKDYLTAKKLQASLEWANRAMEFVIETIPFDAMITRGYLSYHAPRWTRYSPPLGPVGLGENPRTSTEARRRVLTSYILALQDALQDDNES